MYRPVCPTKKLSPEMQVISQFIEVVQLEKEFCSFDLKSHEDSPMGSVPCDIFYLCVFLNMALKADE